MISRAISKNSIMLGLFAIIMAAGLAATELATREQRAESLRRVQSLALEEIIPTSRHDNVLLDDIIHTDDNEYLKLKDTKNIHIARKNGAVIAFIFPVRAPDGYGGAIDSIVGVNLDGTIAGVRILQHRETPGLGDKIELKKSTWALSFNKKSLNNPQPERWKVKKDKGVFDQFTGATITPRAVVQSIYNTLVFFDKHKDSLLQQAQIKTPLSNTADSSNVNEQPIVEVK